MYLITFYYHKSVLSGPWVCLPAIVIGLSENKVKLLWIETISGPESGSRNPSALELLQRPSVHEAHAGEGHRVILFADCVTSVNRDSST